MTELLKYRGQWGGKIESGEEMWWSEPHTRLRTSRRARWGFLLDVRQHFIHRFWKSASLPRTKIADFGCGTGGTTLNFGEIFRTPILGVDIFETQLEIARHHSKAIGSTCSFARLEGEGRIPVADGALDVLMSLDVLGHVPNVPYALAEWARALRPGGTVLLFTEAQHSLQDRSIMAWLARAGADMVSVVPEHISLFPREELEEMFARAGLQVRERFSANVGHFFFFPKDYVLLLKGRKDHRGIYALAWLWNRISKIFPFYPWPFQFLRLGMTYLWGRQAYGTGYFYRLEKR
jgi:SAM-dependent methyltransferase